MTNYEGFTFRLLYWTGATYSYVDMGQIQDINDHKYSPLIDFGYPEMDSNEQEAMDAEGVYLEIGITGEKVFSSWSEAIQWKESVQALLNGQQYTQSLSGGNCWLFIFYPNYFENGSSLWYIRDDTSLSVSSAYNTGIHVILEDFDPKGKSGDQPAFVYSLKAKQQVAI